MIIAEGVQGAIDVRFLMLFTSLRGGMPRTEEEGMTGDLIVIKKKVKQNLEGGLNRLMVICK
jgi:hypothetical protein